jgi:hypothetical protein
MAGWSIHMLSLETAHDGAVPSLAFHVVADIV